MKISVIGLGKLGSPFLAVLASKGHEAAGCDLNPDFVSKINQGIAPVQEPGLQELLTAHRLRIHATGSIEEAAAASDATFVIVPTPSEKNGFFTNRYILETLKGIGSAIRRKDGYHLVVILSTVMPGSMEGEIRPALEAASGRKLGADLGLCYSPEFIALGSVVRNMLYRDLVLIGESDRKAGDLLEGIYRTVCENSPPYCRMNFVNAEIAKLAINTFVTTKISYANMISDLCQRLPGADSDVVTKAVGKDSRIGEKYLKGAVAFGGPCFPRDNIALSALAGQIGARFDLAQATQAINRYQSERLQALIEKFAEGKRTAILGLSYKPGTAVVEESQGIHAANFLAGAGYEVSAYDPMAMEEARKVLRSEVRLYASLTECVQAADTILILTPWPEFAGGDYRGKTVIDCWGIAPAGGRTIRIGKGELAQETIGAGI